MLLGWEVNCIEGRHGCLGYVVDTWKHNDIKIDLSQIIGILQNNIL